MITNLFDLLEKPKQEIILFLQDNQITYSKTNRNTLLFQSDYLDDPFLFEIFFIQNYVTNISMKYNKNSLNENTNINLIEKYKMIFQNDNCQIVMDNTNHPTTQNLVAFKKDEMMVQIIAKQIHSKFEFEISLNKKRDVSKALDISRFFLYLGSGILYGLLMFLFMRDEYTLLNFGIWMIAGVVFAFLFGLIMELTVFKNHKTKNKKFTKKDELKLQEYESKINFNHVFDGKVSIINRNYLYTNKTTNYVAKLYIIENLIKIVFVKRNKIMEVSKDVKSIYESSEIVMISNKLTYVFSLADESNMEIIKDYCKEKLGYKKQEFLVIYQKVEKIMKEYNLFSAYDYWNQNEIYVQEIEKMANAFYQNPHIQFKEFHKIVVNLFYDNYNDQINELAQLIYDALAEKNEIN